MELDQGRGQGIVSYTARLNMYVWAALLILHLIGHVVCPGHDHTQTGPSCYHCDGHHDSFPECLQDKKTCHGHEVCFISDQHSQISINCKPSEECKHIHDQLCSTGTYTSGDCEMCCTDENCLTQTLAIFQNHYVSSTQGVSTPAITVAQPSSDKPSLIVDHLMTETCRDMLFGDGCSASKSTVCGSPTGVSMCPETCGLCTLLQNKFHGNTTCRDQLPGDDCTNTQSICNGVLAEIACPKTCNLCESVIRTLIQSVVTLNVGTVQIWATQTGVVTLPPKTDPVTVTQSLVTDTCTDHFSNCDTMQDVCHNILASQICRKFCNLCGAPNQTPKVDILTAPVVIG